MPKRGAIKVEAPCLKGKVTPAPSKNEEKQATSTEFNNAIRKKSTPAAIKKWYKSSGLKHLKQSNPEKQKFMEEVLGGDFRSEYFKQLTRVEKVEERREEQGWKSWKAITNTDGEDLVKIQVEQGKVLTRKHRGLDHAHASTKKLREEEKLEYLKVEEA